MTAQAFEKHPALAASIEDLGWKASGISLSKWGRFLENLNAALLEREAVRAPDRDAIADVIQSMRSDLHGSYEIADAVIAALPSVTGHSDAVAELMRIKTAIQSYAAHQPLDLLSPSELQADLRAISGDPHVHRRSIGSDQCLICRRDLRDDVHIPAKAEVQP